MAKVGLPPKKGTPVSTSPTFTASYMSGTWKEVEKDGVACLQIKLAYVDEAGTESKPTLSGAVKSCL